MLARMDCKMPLFAQDAHDLDKRVKLFGELRTALRLQPKSKRGKDVASAPAASLKTANEFEDKQYS
jgi:hypothetical protein